MTRKAAPKTPAKTAEPVVSEAHAAVLLPLDLISPDLQNPRTAASMGSIFGLAASIEAQGVLQPILVRPSAAGGYLIVFGERRWLACKHLADLGHAVSSIPAMIADNLDDDEAFEIMVVENLQRQDINELDEARAFRAYLERLGDDSAPALADRLGVSPTYIRRRIRVLELPDQVLEAWSAGILKYGHLEQLARIADDPDAINELLAAAAESHDGHRRMTVADFADAINNRSPELKTALFDPEQTGCHACGHNSDVQKSLFATDAPGRRCNNPKCFKQLQNNWLQANWPEFCKRNKLSPRPGGFRFGSNCGWNDREGFHSGVPKECRPCANYVAILSESGKVTTAAACIGDKSCHKKRTGEMFIKARAGADGGEDQNQDAGSNQDGAAGDQPAAAPPPRADWHGAHFQDEFWKKAITDLTGHPDNHPAHLPPPTIKLLALLAMLRNNTVLLRAYQARYGAAMGDKSRLSNGGCYSYTSTLDIFAHLAALEPEDLEARLAATAVDYILGGDFGRDGRQAVATHLGANLARDFEITEDYIDKKTVAELAYLADHLGISTDPAGYKFLTETLGKHDVEKLKKAELKRLFLESGVTLAGRVPQEVFAA